LPDGGMGSFIVVGLCNKGRSRLKAEAVYIDSDGVEVNIGLYVDGDGFPRDVDFWKVDFNPLAKFPTDNELIDIKCY
jgi:hypothetical protein